MAVTAQSIIDRARTQLIDNGSTPRWTDAELLKWLSDGIRTIASISPSAMSLLAVQPMVAGTRQTIPAGGRLLLSVLRNCNSDGSTVGRAVRVVSKELMDGFDSSWHDASTSATVQNYVYDPIESDAFYVYPPNNGAGYVQLLYSAHPTELTATTDELPISDIYQTPLLDYVLFRAFQKDGDFAAGAAQAQNYLQLFMAFMGVNETKELESNPNSGLLPPNFDKEATAK